jgi:hypothetical protein
MYTYRIVIDGYDALPHGAKSARVVTFSHGFNRAEALRRLGTVQIGQDGTVSDGFTGWPGTRNLPSGPITARSFVTWEVVTMRSVKERGTARIIAE